MLKKTLKLAQDQPIAVINILTVIYFIVGFMYYFSALLSLIIVIIFTSLLITICYFSFPSQQQIPIHTPLKQLAKILVTMYIFGVLDAYCLQDPITLFSIYIILSTIRHYGQFLLINCFHHHQVKWDSFLIYHSFAYTLSNLFLLAQHIITKYIFNFQFKQYHCLVIPGFILTLSSTFIRIMCFFTAKSNFTHQVAYRHRKGHQLVTNGIYYYLRHPSYTSFFYNTVFSMIMVGNFVSAIIFAIALSKFFQERIQIQQLYLIEFFGDKYIKYRQKTYVLIPYIPKRIQTIFNNLMDKKVSRKQN